MDAMAEEGTFWPGVADALLAVLVIVILLTFGGLVLFALNPNSSDAVLRKLQVEMAEMRRNNIQLRDENARLSTENAQLQSENERLKREPPIIELTDAQMVTFAKGEAKISSEFSGRLQKGVFPQLLKIVADYPTVDTIEVIGHTDNSAISSPRSNLDGKLAQVLAGNANATSLVPGSNADLGLMRAAAVREAWLEWVTARNINLPRNIGIRCYSAANAIPPRESGGLSGEQRDERSRRIELRFTKLKGAKEVD